jgi:hypothetical protein
VTLFDGLTFDELVAFWAGFFFAAAFLVAGSFFAAAFLVVGAFLALVKGFVVEVSVEPDAEAVAFFAAVFLVLLVGLGVDCVGACAFWLFAFFFGGAWPGG